MSDMKKRLLPLEERMDQVEGEYMLTIDDWWESKDKGWTTDELEASELKKFPNKADSIREYFARMRERIRTSHMPRQEPHNKESR